MNIEYVGRNFQVDDSLRKHTSEKLAKVVKFLGEPVEVHVTLEVEKHRKRAEVNVHHRHGTLQATEETDGNLLVAIDLAVERLDVQARKVRKKFSDRRRRAQRSEARNGHWPVDVVAGESIRDGGSGAKVIQSRLLHIKPMSIEEAALALDDSKNEFVVFRDSTSDRVSVLYRRKDKNFGLIAPEF